jgi:ferredoxin-type protein NapH
MKLKGVKMNRQKLRKTLILVSFLLFPITIFYFSPMLILVGSAMGIITGSFITFAALFFISLFFGRAWCGWVCPTGGLQEYCFAINDNKTKEKYYKVKYFIWVPWIVLIAIMAIFAGGYTKIDPLLFTNNGISISEPFLYTIYFVVLLITLIPAIWAGKRAACHYLCWMAPFMIIGTKIKNLAKWPSLHLKANKELCVECRLCSKNCPMSLEVNGKVKKEDLKDFECILCGTCVDSCPKDAIKYSFRAPPKNKST